MSSDPRDSPFELWLRGLLEESLLWPVLGVGACTIATFGAALLTAAVADRRPPAMAAVAVMVGISLWTLEGDVRKRRVGPLVWIVLTIWALSALGAYALVKLSPV